MRNRQIFCFFACLGLQLTGLKAAWSEPPQLPPAPNQAQQQEATAIRLIEQLGSERFAVRERATEQLILLGLPAIAHLARATRSENREVRQRSQLVLKVVNELDFKDRLRSFEEDTDGDKSYGLPGWERFREFSGNTEASRKLFAEMQKAERELLNAELKTGEDAGEVLADCCQRLRYSVQIFGTKHQLPPIAAALFVATNEDIPLQKSTHTSLINLCQQLAFANAMTSKSHRSMLQNMLAAWILREDAVPANELLLLALQHDIARSLPRARAIADRPKDIDLADRHSSVLCLAKFGGTDDVARLEAFMSDKTVISRYRLNNLTYAVELRDLVLAALLTVTKRDPAAFGYGRLRLQEPWVFDTQSLGFVNDEDRQLAIGKWRTYRIGLEGG